MYKALQISPMIPTFSPRETKDFFCHTLQFKMTLDEGGYGIFIKDNQSIHMLPAGENIGEMEFYLEVDSVDEVWEQIEGRVSGIRHKPPFDREYGMREIHIDIPGTKTLLFIGQVIKK